MIRRLLTIAMLVLMSGCGNCGDGSDGSEDAGGDDAAMDATDGTDAATDDTGTTDDGGVDAGTDMADDTGSDAAPDMAADAAGDAAADTGPDMAMAAGETCDDAIDVTAGGTWTGDTSNMDDDYESDPTAMGCPSGLASGPDAVYVINPGVDSTYRVTVTPTGQTYDPFIYVRRDDCTTDTCFEGTVLNGPGEAESLEFGVSRLIDHFVIVDGETVSEGAYELEVEIVSP